MPPRGLPQRGDPAWLCVNAGVAAAHIEDQVLPKRCEHIGGKALIPTNEMIGKLRMARAVADDLGNTDFVLITHTDGVSAVGAPESLRGIDLAIERYLDTGIPYLLRSEFPTSDRAPLEKFTTEIKKRFPQARFAFNWSSSFKWYNDPDPISFAELGAMGMQFTFTTLGAQHANSHGLSQLLQDMSVNRQDGYIELQKKEWAEGADSPTEEPPILLRRPLSPPRRQDARRSSTRRGVRRGLARQQSRLALSETDKKRLLQGVPTRRRRRSNPPPDFVVMLRRNAADEATR